MSRASFIKEVWYILATTWYVSIAATIRLNEASVSMANSMQMVWNGRLATWCHGQFFSAILRTATRPLDRKSKAIFKSSSLSLRRRKSWAHRRRRIQRAKLHYVIISLGPLSISCTIFDNLHAILAPQSRRCCPRHFRFKGLLMLVNIQHKTNCHCVRFEVGWSTPFILHSFLVWSLVWALRAALDYVFEEP